MLSHDVDTAFVVLNRKNARRNEKKMKGEWQSREPLKMRDEKLKK